MTADVVLRQCHMHEAPARVGRQREAVSTIEVAAVPPADPLLAARDAAWQQGLEEGRAAGFRQGHEEGFAKGAARASTESHSAQAEAVAQATAALAARTRQLADVIASARVAIQEHVAASEDDVVAVCFETIARVLGATLVTPEGVLAQVRQLLHEAGSEHLVAIHVHPDVAEALRALGNDACGHLAIVPEAGVAPGGCILRGPHGALDARLATILQEVTAALVAGEAG